MIISRIFGGLRRRFRWKRYQDLEQWIALDTADSPILDLGGGPASFLAAHFPQPERLILIDIDPDLARLARQQIPRLNVIIADGQCLPLADSCIGLTVCNSVIEHVPRPEALASEILRVSQSYFVQTPDAKFPVETHSFVGIPLYRCIRWKPARRLLCRLFRANFEYVESVHYLDEVRLRELFPDAQITYEKWLRLTKSFYVYSEDDQGTP